MGTMLHLGGSGDPAAAFGRLLAPGGLLLPGPGGRRAAELRVVSLGKALGGAGGESSEASCELLEVKMFYNIVLCIGFLIFYHVLLI